MVRRCHTHTFPYDAIPHSPTSLQFAEREVRNMIRERAPKEQSGRAAIEAVKSLYADLEARFGAQHTTDAVFFAPVYRTLFCLADVAPDLEAVVYALEETYKLSREDAGHVASYIAR